MKIVHPESLSATVDALNEAFFYERSIPKTEALRAAQFIARRHGQAHAYAGTFALFDDERRNGIHAFTGERLHCAAARHIIGQEACRALLLLNVQHPAVHGALQSSAGRLQECVGPVRRDPAVRWGEYLGGTYCCGRCSVALWRHLLAGGMDDAARRLAAGLRCLRAMRKGDGGWRVFPFWYTLSALVEMDGKAARQELRHAAPQCERALLRPGASPFGPRRREIARRALEAIE